MNKLKYIWNGIKFLVAYCVASVLKISKSNKEIWLVGERKDEAKDNGYHLFKYIRENHSQHKVYYVIDKKSKDLSKIQSLGNIIYADSFKHYVYYIMANKLIMAHLSSCVPDSPICWKAKELGIVKYNQIFIQHGVIKEYINSLTYKNTNVDLFICGAKPEYDFVRDEYGYPEGNVIYTGLARFDNLHNFNEKNQILVMPTWRQWIPSMTWHGSNMDECRKIFRDTEYFKKFDEFINDKNLSSILDRNNMKLIFYPHHEMQGYIDLFVSNSKNIIIASEDEYDVQTLLKESKVLVTDYSSVAFDFAYMRKSVIYYQFDTNEYNMNHYSKGYFNYNKHGFGPVVEDIGSLIYELNKYFETNTENNIYTDRVDEFFPLYDSNNCYRIYKEICSV